MAKQVEVKVPDIGDFDDVPVIEVLVKTGDTVEKEDSLITLESEKAVMEVPAPQTGTVKNVKVKVGDKVSEGSVVLLLDTDEDSESAEDKDGETESADESAHDDEGESSEKPDPSERENDKPSGSKPPKPEKKNGSTGKKPARGSRTVKVPDIGDFDDVPVIEILVKDGDTVEKDAPLITLESEKATMEVPSPAAGTVRGMKLKEGDTVSKGDAICELEAGDAGAEDGDEAESDEDDTSQKEKSGGDNKPSKSARDNKSGEKKKSESPKAESSDSLAKSAGEAPPHASPSVRKFARELGVDLVGISGSGPHDRILREDVQNHVKKALSSSAPDGLSGIPAIPPVDFAKYGEVESKPLARIRKLSAAHLHRAWLNLPHVTQTDDADITDLEAFRHAQNAKRGAKLTLLPIILKAVAKAIDRYPEFAASLAVDGETLVLKHYRHLGFAADTPNGLVVPVIRDVDHKGIVQLAKESGELAGRARDGKLKPDEMKGGVFTVSSLGGIGGGYFTPIINAPEVAILGVSRAVMRPLWDGEQFQPRLMLPLSLSYDHRVIDGAHAARFIVHLVGLLSDLRKLVL